MRRAHGGAIWPSLVGRVEKDGDWGSGAATEAAKSVPMLAECLRGKFLTDRNGLGFKE
jgi:hypothetical protein